MSENADRQDQSQLRTAHEYGHPAPFVSLPLECRETLAQWLADLRVRGRF
ncbi:hypothetical protein [Nocardia yunnanensis]|nr:hypothetical protein [Nocardia yunnanensis]